MKLVYKCDYCCETGEDKAKIEHHELKECRSNPDLKRCGSCEHEFWDGAPGDTFLNCRLGIVGLLLQEDIREGKAQCDLWVDGGGGVLRINGLSFKKG